MIELEQFPINGNTGEQDRCGMCGNPLNLEVYDIYDTKKRYGQTTHDFNVVKDCSACDYRAEYIMAERLIGVRLVVRK